MSLNSYRSLAQVAAGEPITTSEAAARLRMPVSSASRLLASLAERGLTRNIRPGLWVIGEDVPDRLALASALTFPAPAYVSFTSALNYHGVIDQLPRQITVASTGRPRTIKTSLADYVVHRIPPDLFDGWIQHNGARIASPEKALFDIAYIAAVRGRPMYVPEMDLPAELDPRAFDRWLARVASPRLRTLTRRGLDHLVSRAVR